jgi:hypothetical protein
MFGRDLNVSTATAPFIGFIWSEGDCYTMGNQQSHRHASTGRFDMPSLPNTFLYRSTSAAGPIAFA